jgi:hypothetical protein
LLEYALLDDSLLLLALAPAALLDVGGDFNVMTVPRAI